MFLVKLMVTKNKQLMAQTKLQQLFRIDFHRQIELYFTIYYILKMSKNKLHVGFFPPVFFCLIIAFYSFKKFT